MTDNTEENGNEDFKNFLLKNAEIIKEQGADFIKSVNKIAEILNDDQINAILQEIKNS
jgi:hypothetical protein